MGLWNRFASLFRNISTSSKQRIPLSVVFSRFRKVIDSNTKSLEIMADMGDKLSGDYIFDIAYIKQVCKELSESVYQSINSLNFLCQNRYEILYDIYNRINSKIESIVFGEDKQGPMVKFLEEIGPEDMDIVGGKMAHLAEIKRNLGYPVPDGFVITSFGFKDFLQYNDLEGLVKELNRGLSIGKIEDVISCREKLEKSILSGEPSPKLKVCIEQAIDEYKRRYGNYPLVIRSSAQEEDQELSFAGQFKTVVNVPPEISEVIKAYKEVIASLFGEKAISYVQRFGIHFLEMSMAVGCLKLINGRTSGVMFTVNLQDAGFDSVVITSNWGLGTAVVEGSLDVDRFVVSRNDPDKILEKEVPEKKMFFVVDSYGVKEAEVEPDKRRKPSLQDEEIKRLVRIGLSLERYFKRPQDVEWTIDRDGRIFILQSRAVSMIQQPIAGGSVPEIKNRYKVVVEKKGRVAQGGIATGAVFLFKNLKDLDKFPEGAILVSHRDSSHFVRVMPKVSAILTNVGSPTSHMATLCREFRVPAIVGIGDITQRVKEGEIITVDADDNCVYRGKVEELLKFQAVSQLDLTETREFRLLRKVLHLVSPLNLVDPLMKDFKPEACKTFHDLLRFCHEKAVQELINLGKEGNALLDRNVAKRLNLKIPTGILVIDLGGGLKPEAVNKNKVSFEDIECIPLRSVLEGMLEPGVWQTQAVQMRIKDLISSMLRTPDLAPRYVGENIAVISTHYLNLSLRFGYHFNIIDIYCSPNVRENHIYFRFIGGAADLSKRTRRIKLIEKILSYYEFNVVTKGDLLVARLANIPLEEIEELLKMTGRLIGFTRQLDVLMESDYHIEIAFKKFISGRFE